MNKVEEPHEDQRVYSTDMMLRVSLILVVLSTLACSASSHLRSHLPGHAFPEAEAVFHQDPRWLGADAALSIPLEKDRTVWLFGDTFVAESDARVRSESKMVRNSVAIQVGKDLRHASIEFHWRQDSDGSPASFFPESTGRWYWPGHGIRLEDGPLIIFLYALIARPNEGLGFASAGYAIAVIDDPDQSPDNWNPRITDMAPSLFDALPATAVVQDGEHIIAVAIRQDGQHAGALVRHPAALLAQSDVSGAEWWAGSERGWVPESLLGPGGPTFVLDDAGSECSLHWDERRRSFIHVASYGLGASTIGLRTAPAITGPWSSPEVVYRPPESDGPRPFVYAAKAHPELAGPDVADLVVTYAVNSFDFGDLFTQKGARSLYWPRVVLVRMSE